MLLIECGSEARKAIVLEEMEPNLDRIQLLLADESVMGWLYSLNSCFVQAHDFDVSAESTQKNLVEFFQFLEVRHHCVDMREFMIDFVEEVERKTGINNLMTFIETDQKNRSRGDK
jgi:hypothetical protein